MNFRILGTAAAEGVPALFCRCEVCQHAIEQGGKNLRSRSSMLIDEVLKIDFPPDTYYHMIRDGLDLRKVRDLIFTHAHSDHLAASDVMMRREGFSHGCEHPLRIYGNESVLGDLRAAAGNVDPNQVTRTLLRPFETVETTTCTVTPMLADHDPMQVCFLLLIERNGKNLLYGHDSGWFPEATWACLERFAATGKKLDAAVLDCTHGKIPQRRNHMGGETVVEVRDKLASMGLLRESSPVIATHFSHNGGLTHEALEDYFRPYGIAVAYDGMKVEV